MSDGPKHPEVEVDLGRIDGNAAAIIGATAKALQRADVPRDEIDAYRTEATSGDYDNVLQTTMRWVEVC